MNKNISKLTIMGMLLALALIMSYIETLIPMPLPVPAMKLGLPNLIIVLILYKFGAGYAILINVMRIIISGFAFGGLSAVLFSLSGAAFSFLAMLLLKKLNIFSISGVSIAGGVFHNAGQLLVAALMVKTSQVVYFIPPLMVMGCITGLAIGFAASAMLHYINRF